MSFKDLAKIEGYNLDAMEAELKAARARIVELEAENQGLKDGSVRPEWDGLFNGNYDDDDIPPGEIP